MIVDREKDAPKVEFTGVDAKFMTTQVLEDGFTVTVDKSKVP